MIQSNNTPPDFLGLLQNLPRASIPPIHHALFRDSADDFVVTERLGFEPSAEGDHLLLQIQKRGLNTQDIVELLTKRFSVKSVDIGYCGLKDRHAVTDQWFSVHLPGRTAEALQDLCVNSDSSHSPSRHGLEMANNVFLLSAARHNRKLRTGSHLANRFVIVLKNLDGDLVQLKERFRMLEMAGFPNYFGEQRFGREARNLFLARSMFNEPQRRGGGSKRYSRAQRSLYLSAARSFLFNRLLASRINANTWLTPLQGEPLILEGSRSFFIPEPGPANMSLLVERIQHLDIHTSGVLWGVGSAETVHDIFEREVLCDYDEFLRGLEKEGLKQSRRALRVVPRCLTFESIAADAVRLGFELPAGSYATALLRELIENLQNAQASVGRHA